MSVKSAIAPAWWKEVSCYQIYPSSFKDSNGDGWGDLGGIIEELDYVQQLGVDMIWCSPINKSPMFDMGYDISDYKNIDPSYGTLQQFDKLIAEMDKRGLKFILDLVVNHTSHEHPWFVESRSSKTNPKRDWYIWKKGTTDANGKRQPPNNWGSFFTPSAWEYDETTDEYYLHLFAKEQPDLNWENPQVRAAVADVVTFWMERGVKGFRLDAINLIAKDPRYPDNPIINPKNEFQFDARYFANQPKMHEYLRELGHIFDKYGAFTVGEMGHVETMEELLKIVGFDAGELNMIFQFDLVDIGCKGKRGKYTDEPFNFAHEVTESMKKWNSVVPEKGGWTSSFIENHDQARAISRFLDDTEYRSESSKLMALLVLFQGGTPFIYQGQELGLKNFPLSWPLEEYKDLATHHEVDMLRRQGASDEQKEELRKELQKKARDHARVPMQWDDSEYAGFSSHKPWMKVNDDYKEWNVKNELKNPDSPFHFWSKALKLRKELTKLSVYGHFRVLDAPENVIAFSRANGDDVLYVVLNTSNKEVKHEFTKGKVLLNNYDDEKAKAGVLRPFEGFIAKA